MNLRCARAAVRCRSRITHCVKEHCYVVCHTSEQLETQKSPSPQQQRVAAYPTRGEMRRSLRREVSLIVSPNATEEGHKHSDQTCEN